MLQDHNYHVRGGRHDFARELMSDTSSIFFPLISTFLMHSFPFLVNPLFANPTFIFMLNAFYWRCSFIMFAMSNIYLNPMSHDVLWLSKQKEEEKRLINFHSFSPLPSTVRQKEIYLRLLQQIYFRWSPYKPAWFTKSFVSSPNVTQITGIAYNQQNWEGYLGTSTNSILAVIHSTILLDNWRRQMT